MDMGQAEIKTTRDTDDCTDTLRFCRKTMHDEHWWGNSGPLALLSSVQNTSLGAPFLLAWHTTSCTAGAAVLALWPCGPVALWPCPAVQKWLVWVPPRHASGAGNN